MNGGRRIKTTDLGVLSFLGDQFDSIWIFLNHVFRAVISVSEYFIFNWKY